MSLSESKYDPPPAPAHKTPPALVAFTLTVLILCFVAFSIVYLCKYCFAGIFHMWALHRTASGSLVRLSPDRSPPRGLNNTLINGFPTFLYSDVKDHRKEKSYSLECAICLLEFEDDSMLRLLTICFHVFHQECIDLWFENHKTCPVCRTDLDVPPNQTGEESVNTSEITRAQIHEGDQHDDHVRKIMQQEEHIFSRSHSTGHSIVMIRGEEKDDEKYTLRLPEHVIRGGHNITKSCTNYSEMTLTMPTPCSNCGFVKPVSGSSSLAQAQEA
ncbi:RING-H2 finger protein ATL29 [Medicago truncatula]|uniref:RING-H2 finger protein ATL29 n=1 Tax=Medicago truncatula TaxID=3880 RepID=UPI0019676872|nr:RING-H2 finger protein ATL29 [Medicago truncatula]